MPNSSSEIFSRLRVIGIATINVWNRLNVATRQVAGEWVKSAEAKAWVEKELAAR